MKLQLVKYSQEGQYDYMKRNAADLAVTMGTAAPLSLLWVAGSHLPI